MTKYKFPKAHEILEKKIIGYKQEQVWTYLEREMQEKAKSGKKPYNHKVGDWLKFMKDLKHYYYVQGKENYKRLEKEGGPVWFYQLSVPQMNILADMRRAIHHDWLRDRPAQIKTENGIDAVILAILFTQERDKSTATACKEMGQNYDYDSRTMMSAIASIDYEECIKELNNLTKIPPSEPLPVERKKKTYTKPNIRFGEYLSKSYVPYPIKQSRKAKGPPPLDYKIIMKSKKSLEDLATTTAEISVEKRRHRSKRFGGEKRECKYRFWEAPSSLRTKNSRMIEYIRKLKMYKLRAKPRYLKYKIPDDSTQCHIGEISYSGGHPNYLLQNYITLPTEYELHNGGFVRCNKSYTPNILGHYGYPNPDTKCPFNCDCMKKLKDRLRDYLKNTKCRCGHMYDYGHTRDKSVPVDQYMYAPSKYGPLFFNEAKIFQLDTTDDFIKNTFAEALRSESEVAYTISPSISPYAIPVKTLLGIFLGDLMETALLLPHLPDANLLLNLQAWVRKRVRGDYGPSKTKRLIVKSQRRWRDLSNMDFKARPYRIPWTPKEKEKMNFSHRPMLGYICQELLENYRKRNAEKQLDQSRLYWSTFKHDMYPCDNFLDVYYSYLPARPNDIIYLNALNALDKSGIGKTCKLQLPDFLGP